MEVSTRTAWLMVAAVFAFVIYGLFFTAKAEERQLFISVVICQSQTCMDHHLTVQPGVNEVMCTYGSFSTVTAWQLRNYPTWTIKSYKCTYKPEYSL